MESLENVINYIIEKGQALKNKYASEIPMRIDYVAIFCQNEAEFKFFNDEVAKLGSVAQETPTGKVYLLSEIFPNQNLGTKIIKIRIVDPTRPQRGDVDFYIYDFENFRDKLLNDLPTKLIRRENMELIELSDPEFDVLVYFSNPPVSKTLNVKY